MEDDSKRSKRIRICTGTVSGDHTIDRKKTTTPTVATFRLLAMPTALMRLAFEFVSFRDLWSLWRCHSITRKCIHTILVRAHWIHVTVEDTKETPNCLYLIQLCESIRVVEWYGADYKRHLPSILNFIHRNEKTLEQWRIEDYDRKPPRDVTIALSRCRQLRSPPPFISGEALQLVVRQCRLINTLSLDDNTISSEDDAILMAKAGWSLTSLHLKCYVYAPRAYNAFQPLSLSPLKRLEISPLPSMESFDPFMISTNLIDLNITPIDFRMTSDQIHTILRTFQLLTKLVIDYDDDRNVYYEDLCYGMDCNKLTKPDTNTVVPIIHSALRSLSLRGVGDSNLLSGIRCPNLNTASLDFLPPSSTLHIEQLLLAAPTLTDLSMVSDVQMDLRSVLTSCTNVTRLMAMYDVKSHTHLKTRLDHEVSSGQPPLVYTSLQQVTTDAPHVLQILSCPNLEILSVDNAAWISTTPSFSSFLRSCPLIERLSLDGMHRVPDQTVLSDNSTEVTYFECMPLSRLKDFSYNMMLGEVIYTVLSACGSSLTALHLNPLTEKTASVIVPLIPPSITFISISFNEGEDYKWLDERMTLLFERCRSLERLVIGMIAHDQSKPIRARLRTIALTTRSHVKIS